MARRVINMARTGPWAQRWAVRVSLMFIVAAGLIFVRTLLAVHETVAFELDGDATAESPSAGPDDWDRVCFEQAIKEGLTPAAATDRCDATGGTELGGFPAIAVAWTAESARSATIFTGGGSKDPQDIDQWAWKNDPDAGDELHGGLPDKDNLLHAFAARYSLAPTVATGNCPNGTPTGVSTIPCDVLFFGLDRLDNSGDAQTGFWFLQNQVALDAETKSGGGFGFSGLHAQGDLLVISNFSNGGTTSTITVYKWETGCTGENRPKKGVGGFTCGAANLAQLASSTAANCETVAGANDPFCGLVNDSNSQPPDGLIIMPWQFVDKSGTPNNGALNGEFYEAGINLSLLGLAGECFSTVVSETRSSTSATATLKDFIIGQFANCIPGLTTQASETVAEPVAPGVEVHDDALVKVTGGSATNTPDPTGTVTFFLCGPLGTDDTNGCESGGTNVGTDTLDGGSDPLDGEATARSPDVNTDASPLGPGRYCFRAEWPGDNLYPGALSETNNSSECFSVQDVATTVTAQDWLPNDTATVTLASGQTPSGTVTFTLYPSANCTGTALATFPDRPLTNGVATTNNTTTIVLATPNKTISWLAQFNPDDPLGVTAPAAACETSTVTIDDDITK